MGNKDEYDDLDDLLDEDELKAKILGSSPGAGAAPAEDDVPEVKEPEIGNLNLDDKAGIEELLKGIGASDTDVSNLMAELDGKPESKSASGGSFEDKISETMNRLKKSSQGPGMGDASEANILEKLLADIQNGAGDLGDLDGGGVDRLLSSLLSELSSKEILYEPLKELNSGYPEWMEKHASGLEAAERERLQKQQKIVAEIVAKFESADYSDSDKAAREYIDAKMLDMQATGAPPEELTGDLMGIPGLSGGANAPPELLSGCATQ